MTGEQNHKWRNMIIKIEGTESQNWRKRVKMTNGIMICL
jgi:hypothetical protein